MRQSPQPSGSKTGATRLDICANMLCATLSSVTIFRWKSKVCKSHTMMLARKMTVKARVRKSFALSHSRCQTFIKAGSR